MKNDWYVYIIECADGTLYTGVTTDIERRIKEHDAGTGARYTKGRGPVVLRYTAQFDTRGNAQKEEARIKRLPTSDKRRLLR